MSNPYQPLAPAPKEFTLDEALKATVAKDGTYHCGKLEFPNQRDYNDFVAGQRALGGTPQQLATLNYVETNGHAPHMGAMEAAPKGTKVEDLLDVKGKTPDANGFYHMGTLLVHKDEIKQFDALQRDATARNPEALNALYHLEHAPDKDVTFRVTKDNDRGDRYDPNTNTIYWNPHTMIRDAYNKEPVSAETAGLHEVGHWAGRDVGQTLQRIPAGKWENMEEKRVIEGVEARDMALQHRAPRHSHYGWPLPTDKIDSITPSLTTTQNGVTREMHAPYTQSGHVMSVNNDGTTTIAIRGDGKHPDHQVTYKTEQLSLAMGGQDPARVLSDAISHKDTVQFQLTADGKMLYSDPAQQQRQAGPAHDPGFKYPDQMYATHEPVPLQTQQRQPVEVGR